MACNPVDSMGTIGQWGIAPERIPGWPTGLTEEDYRIEITFHGNPNCCGDQSASSRIWIGGNDAESAEVNFVGPAAPAVGYSRVMWKGIEMAKTEKTKGRWYSYVVIKKDSAVTLLPDGATLQTDVAHSLPDRLIVGGPCWTGCQATDLASTCLIGNWNNFGYDIRFFSMPVTPAASY